VTRARAGTLAPCLALLIALVASPTAGAPAASTPAELSISATPQEITLGGGLSVSGHLAGGEPAAPATPLELQASTFPSGKFRTIARAAASPDGSYAFPAVKLEADAHLRVVVEGSPAIMSPPVGVIVDPTVSTRAVSLGGGRTHLTVRLGHASYGDSQPVSARWFVAARGSDLFRLVAITPTRELERGLTYADTTIDPPSARFSYRVCVNAPWTEVMGRQPAASAPCPQADYRSPGPGPGPSFEGDGEGVPVAAYPSSQSIAAAERFLSTRAGRTSFAVVDSLGHLSGARVHEHFQTASVVKVMMLVAYLQKLSAEHRGLDSSDTALLYPMIHISDNEAASAVFAKVGAAALVRLAREAGMADYAPAVGWWAFTQTSAADQARFFLSLDELIPAQFYAYARSLLSGIEPSQSWGVPAVARPQWRVFFKTGALPSEGLFNEAARLERGGVTFTIAVFTDGDPSMDYGEQTIEGVAAALLAHTPG